MKTPIRQFSLTLLITVLVAIVLACGGMSPKEESAPPSVELAPDSGEPASPSEEPASPLGESVLPVEEPEASSAELVPHPPVENRIVYVDLDRKIWTTKPDGSDKIKITLEDGRYAWPTLSPDGRKLVFSGVVPDDFGGQKISLYTFTPADGAVREVFTNDPGPPVRLAPDVPHYSIWSPDSNRLAFVSGSVQGLRLYVNDFRNDVGPVPAVDNGPVWISWSPSSRYLLVHRGVDQLLVDTDDGVRVTDLALPVPAHSVPDWWPQGDRMTLVHRDSGDGGFGIYVQGVGGEESVLMEPVLTSSVFSWSPTGELLAVGHIPTRAVPIQGLKLFSRDGTVSAAGIEEGFIAYFWSPDGTKVAYVTLTGVPGVFRWNILNVEDGTTWPLAEFAPSTDQIVWFQFFDQYAHSHSLWSPDSRSIVFAGRLETGAITASVNAQQTDHIIVMDVTRNPVTRVIADGLLAFWSSQ